MSEPHTLLIEIGTEELPPGLVMESYGPFANVLSLFRLHYQQLLTHAPDHLPPLYTPRRIAVKIKGVATHQPTETEERKGPRATEIDENDPAAKGFAKSCGAEVKQLKIRDGRLFCRTETGGRALKEVLPELLPLMPKYFCGERLMRWGAGEHAFARPVHWLCVLHGKEVIDCELFGVRSGRITYGHRHLCTQPLTLESADDYEEVLEKKGRVIVDFSKRRAVLKAQVEGAKEGLLNEAVATTEWPQLLTANFDKAFLSLPPEVITQTLENGLKAFVVKDHNNKPSSQFRIVVNIKSKTPQTIVRGYENVVRARLKDAEFFFEQDKKTPLEDRRQMLERTLFQEKLGTLADKAKRLEQLAEFLAPLCGASPEHTRRAAQLCKCDLDSGLVGEYPKLQGIMGGYYAEADDEHQAVAVAIRDHYLPQSHLDAMPKSPEGTTLALADKIDTLAGFWRADLTPSGSKDPYGLRRAAAGILRILVKSDMDLDVHALTKKALAGYGDVNKRTYQDLCLYMREQLCDHVFVRSFPEHQDKTPDCVSAVAEVIFNMETPLRPGNFFKRLDAIASFIKTDAADSLIAANKRIRNILAKSGCPELDGEPDIGAMTEDAERDLFEAANACGESFDRQFNEGDYVGAMNTLTQLREPVDHFFDEVLVMSDNKEERENRLKLLWKIRWMFLKIADFSVLNPAQPKKTQ